MVCSWLCYNPLYSHYHFCHHFVTILVIFTAILICIYHMLIMLVPVLWVLVTWILQLCLVCLVNCLMLVCVLQFWSLISWRKICDKILVSFRTSGRTGSPCHRGGAVWERKVGHSRFVFTSVPCAQLLDSVLWNSWVNANLVFSPIALM